ncbi:MAG: glycosyltransferase [Verrucomicrobia bacterium]|nr:glycosyltransferase [Verrucomicrobiota bacterium]
MSRLLIITNGPLCRNPRVVKEADTLGRAGHDVTVLAVRNHAPSEVFDTELLRNAPYRRVTVDTLPPAGGFSPTAFRRRLGQWLARRATRVFGWQSPHTLGPARPLLRQARALPADLTIVHNEVSHCVGLRLLDEGRRVAADIEDWHSEDLLPQDRVARPLKLIRETERGLLHRAVHTTTTSHALAAALHDRYGGRHPDVIANAFPLQPLPVREPAAPPVFFWFSQTLGPARGLEHFLAAWTHTRAPSRLVLLGEARGDYARELLAGLPGDFRARVSLLPLVPPAELPAVIARHDIGLALEQPFIVNRNLTITNKIIQYLNAGLAVVASDTAGQREVLAHDPQAGVLVGTHETAAFAAALDTLLTDRTALAARQHAARRLAERVYSWEREAPRLLELVETALRAGAAAPPR